MKPAVIGLLMACYVGGVIAGMGRDQGRSWSWNDLVGAAIISAAVAVLHIWVMP